jgi:hypothetical protein
MDAIEYHHSLMLETYCDGDFDEMIEYGTAIIILYGRDPLFSSALEQVQASTRLMANINAYWYVINLKRNENESAKGVAQQALVSVNGIVKTLENTKLGIKLAYRRASGV